MKKGTRVRPMKNKTKLNLMPYLSLLLVLVSVFSISCSMFVTPAYSVEVENKSAKPLAIFSRTFMKGEWGEMHDRGQVGPGERRAIFAMVRPTSESLDKKYQVDARGLDGKIVRSWEFPFQERVLLVIDRTDVAQ